MSTGLLIITHNQIGAALLATATHMLESCPLESRALEIDNNGNPDDVNKQAREFIEQLDQGDGVLGANRHVWLNPQQHCGKIIVPRKSQRGGRHQPADAGPGAQLC